MNKKNISPSGVKITDESEGKVSAVFATLGVKDSDGDVTVKGAFEEGAPVRVSAYNHASWKEGHLPIGKGTIRTEGDHAIADLQFFMDTTGGKETFNTIKGMGGDLQEWSYGFDTLESEPGEFEGQKVKFLKSLKVHEVSPVILGAGMGTRTLSAKSADKDSAPVGEMKFTEHIESVVADVKVLTDRASEVMAMRREKGKGISQESRDALAELEPALKQLEEVLSSEPPTANDMALLEIERSRQLLRR